MYTCAHAVTAAGQTSDPGFSLPLHENPGTPVQAGDKVHLFQVVEVPLMEILVGADDIPVTYTDPEADRRNVS
jgi:hypothetical protein